MAAKFLMNELLNVYDEAFTARLGAGTMTASAANKYGNTEVGKPVKLVGESRYDLAVAGDQIEGFIVAVEPATSDDYNLGTVRPEGRKAVVFDGLQATPGTGTVAIGDYVVSGSITAQNTALGAGPKVCKATTQTGMYYAWRVISLGTVGTGAVGTVGVIDRINR